VQIALYLHLSGESKGTLVLRDKWFWRLRFVPIPRAAVEGLIQEAIQKAQSVNEHIAAGTLPDPMDYSDAICGRCEFKNICLPSRAGTGAAWVDDERLVDDLRERDHLQTFSRRYDDLDRSVKERVRAIGEPEIVISGQYVAHVKTSTRKRLKATGESYETTTTTIRELPQPLVPIRGEGEKP
jgi:hypothetical protein